MSLFRKMALFVASFSALLLSGCGDDIKYNMREGVTEISREVYELHMIAIWVCVIIGIITFGVMFYSMFAHRKSKNPNPAKFSHSTVVEIIWTAIPFIILIALAVPAIGLLIKMEDASDSELTVMVKGYQWKWEYKYIDGDDNLANDVRFFSNLDQASRDMSRNAGSGFSGVKIEDENYLLEVDNPLVIPVNKKVRFLVTSDDVIHSFWVPDFSVKKDAIPGFINEVWAKVDEPGTYRGVCAELCGQDHGFMPIVVKVLPQDEYDAWYAEKVAEAEAGPDLNERTMSQLMAEGEAAYNTYCKACHMENGQGSGPFPSLVGTEMVTGEGSLTKHIDTVLNGVPGTAMQAFGNQLTEAEIAAIITYERNAWGNDTGDIVQPQEIHDIKNGGGE
ncbi:cytochrome c oxidase subunit II [Kangiella spongicola]|uniref:Cytochrome c oxidase subunit 2 n=1 Tax=Kangiella spongicola TaxID=796379 RepID=A0A318D5G6_9GAMM|nr:cytochrome c oxidase subunit II [Kangiella spongicola]MBV35232.1 cytochrome c oxidase subunit II [Rickettsiales bacterium]PXF64506.1 cytochrome c oxidase subunit II [Kangiella spongicola]